MRIPKDKIWRAFPALDQFSDAQCNRFVQSVRQSTAYRSNVAFFVSLAVLAGLVIAMIVFFSLADPVRGLLAALAPPRAVQPYADLLSCTVFMGVPALAGLVARDMALWRALKSAIWRRIDRIRCANCRYMLLGQSLQGDLIRCPECGVTTTLMALGLRSEADLLPPDLRGPVR